MDLLSLVLTLRPEQAAPSAKSPSGRSTATAIGSPC